MENSLRTATLSFLLFASSVAIAGGDGDCHFHGRAPAKEAVVVDCANGKVKALVGSGKIENSWSAVKLDKAETVDGKNTKEWKLAFKNPAAKDTSKQTLYLFYSLTGNFIAANFTGQ